MLVLQHVGSTQNDVYTCPSKNPDPKSPGRGSSEIKETSWDLCESSEPGVRSGAGAGAEESVTGQEDLLSALRETLGKVRVSYNHSNIPAYYIH
jgi:hypothetical protein